MKAAGILSEKKYKVILEDFFTRIWGETVLWSHDLGHHRRVWKFAKEILPYFGDKRNAGTELSEKLIIACYLHDIGMSIDRGVRHGHHGRRILGRFLRENNMDETDYLDVADAIECHDQKDYDLQDSGNIVLKILSVADDLDAFGRIGICRYSEIYLLRGADLSQIGFLIRENAARRFENYKLLFARHPNLFNRHKNRYLIVDSFFEIYNQKVKNYNFGNHNPAGHCGIIEIISNLIGDKKSTIEFLTHQLQFSSDIFISDFINSVQSETVL